MIGVEAPAHGEQQIDVSGEAVEQSEVRLRLAQRVMLVLSVDADQTIADRLEDGERRQRAVQMDAIAATAGQRAAHQQLLAVGFEAGRGKPLAQGVGADREHRLDRGLLLAGADHLGRGLTADRQLERGHEDGLAGARLAGDDG